MKLFPGLWRRFTPPPSLVLYIVSRSYPATTPSSRPVRSLPGAGSVLGSVLVRQRVQQRSNQVRRCLNRSRQAVAGVASGGGERGNGERLSLLSFGQEEAPSK